MTDQKTAMEGAPEEWAAPKALIDQSSQLLAHFKKCPYTQLRKTFQRSEVAMIQILFDLPDESLMPFNGSEERAGKEMRMAAAAKFYEMGQLSSGAAARLAGLPRTLFLTRLADYGVDTFNSEEDDFNQETRLA